MLVPFLIVGPVIQCTARSVRCGRSGAGGIIRRTGRRPVPRLQAVTRAATRRRRSSPGAHGTGPQRGPAPDAVGHLRIGRDRLNLVLPQVQETASQIVRVGRSGHSIRVCHGFRSTRQDTDIHELFRRGEQNFVLPTLPHPAWKPCRPHHCRNRPPAMSTFARLPVSGRPGSGLEIYRTLSSVARDCFRLEAPPPESIVYQTTSSDPIIDCVFAMVARQRFSWSSDLFRTVWFR